MDLNFQRWIVCLCAVLVIVTGCRDTASERAASPPPRDRLPPSVRSACAEVGQMLARLLGQNPAVVEELGEGAAAPHCRVVAATPAEDLDDERDPADEMRGWLGSMGFEEDESQLADGPGTSGFTFWRSGVRCRFQVGAHGWIEDGEIHAADDCQVAVRCWLE